VNSRRSGALDQPVPAILVRDHSLRRARVEPVLARIPRLDGEPIRLVRTPGLRDRRGPVHAGSFLRQRRIEFNCSQPEFARVLVHELFHFVWVRLGNPRRWSYERLLKRELGAEADGELGWSADWRKRRLRPDDIRHRTHRWRDYCCESFCDSAAWLYSGIGRHEEFTLVKSWRRHRAQWFAKIAGTGPLSI
jgi:hypothetical protein